MDAHSWKHTLAFSFFGFLTAAGHWLFGLLLTVTVIAAPIGLGLMELGKFLFAPLGHAMVSKDDLKIEQNALWKTYSTIVMLLYLPFGVVFLVLSCIQVAALWPDDRRHTGRAGHRQVDRNGTQSGQQEVRARRGRRRTGATESTR